MLCALIMAGGKGTRFWPLSTEEKPKQFLNLIGNKSMIQLTVDRIKPIVPIERIFICTGQMYIDLIKQQLPEIPNENIIIEPEGRNTAPCIALSAFIMKRYYLNANMIVLPSDHIIDNENKFRDIILLADKFVNNNNQSIVTLGMAPTRPETGYGYIKYSNLKKKSDSIIKVDSFVEKPNKERAQEYLFSGEYLWNGGIFVWSIDNILDKIKKYSSNTYEALRDIEFVEDAKVKDIINSRYKDTESISIDYAVLEKTSDIYVIPSNFGWDDVGSWRSLERYGIKDEKGNVFNAKGAIYKSKNNIVVTSKKVLLNNVEDLILVETEEYIMISSKEKEQEIKLAQELLRK